MDESLIALTRYESRKKSVTLAYVLWFFFGMTGVHRFYVGDIGVGVALLVLTVVGAITILAGGVGFILLAIAAFWSFADLFVLSGCVHEHNEHLANRMFF